MATERLRQPFTFAVHVCTLLPEHCVAPACEQLLLQATQAEPLQYFPEPHEVATERLKQPFESAAHVCTCDPEHWVAPACGQVLLQLCFEPPQESRTVPEARVTRTTFMASPQRQFIAPKSNEKLGGPPDKGRMVGLKVTHRALAAGHSRHRQPVSSVAR